MIFTRFSFCSMHCEKYNIIYLLLKSVVTQPGRGEKALIVGEMLGRSSD